MEDPHIGCFQRLHQQVLLAGDPPCIPPFRRLVDDDDPVFAGLCHHRCDEVAQGWRAPHGQAPVHAIPRLQLDGTAKEPPKTVRLMPVGDDADTQRAGPGRAGDPVARDDGDLRRARWPQDLGGREGKVTPTFRRSREFGRGQPGRAQANGEICLPAMAQQAQEFVEHQRPVIHPAQILLQVADQVEGAMPVGAFTKPSLRPSAPKTRHSRQMADWCQTNSCGAVRRHIPCATGPACSQHPWGSLAYPRAFCKGRRRR